MAQTQEYPHVAAANEYAKGVVSGEIVACRWVRLACERQLKDLRKRSWKYKFSHAAAERVCKFVELFPHTKGKWAKSGERLKLEPWQCFILTTVFGWVNKRTEYRRFKEVYIEVPRKNGKSALTSALALYILTADGEAGAEIFCGATSEAQARLVFVPAQIMARKTPDFVKHYGVEVNANNINMLATGSKFEPMIGKPGDGDSPSCAIIDEYHEHKSSVMFDTMLTGMGARTQPLMWTITTAGSNLASPCRAYHLQIEELLDGVYADETTFGIIYTIDKEDDWTSVDALKKANPNWGISIEIDNLLRSQELATQRANKQNQFKTKHLNIWVNASSAWMNSEKWLQCADTNLRIEDFAGEECIAGVDLASRVDMAALLFLFRRGGDYYLFPKFYLPEVTIEDERNQHYQEWLLEGYLTSTPGEVIDFDFIEEDLLEHAEKYDVLEVAYDKAHATHFATNMMKHNLEMIDFGQRPSYMTEPMQELEGLIYSGKVHFDGNPIISWMMSNVICKNYPSGLMMPSRERDENKIDGVVALFMTLGRFLVGSDKNQNITQGFVDL